MHPAAKVNLETLLTQMKPYGLVPVEKFPKLMELDSSVLDRNLSGVFR